MPKHKTHKGIQKRIRITGGKKLKHRRRGTSHLNSGLGGKRRRHLHNDIVSHKSVARRLERALQTRLTGTT